MESTNSYNQTGSRGGGGGFRGGRGGRGGYNAGGHDGARPYGGGGRQTDGGGYKGNGGGYGGRQGGGGYNNQNRDEGQQSRRGGGGGYKGDSQSSFSSGGYQRGSQGGGYNDRGGRGGGGFNKGFGGGGHFASKPSSSLVAISQNPEDAKAQKCRFFTNQFKMQIGKNAPQIHQYPISIFNGEVSSADVEDSSAYQYSPFEIGKVVDRETKRIELMIGKFIYSGFNIWTTQPITESYFLSSKLMGQKVTLMIDYQGEYIVNTADIDNPQRQDCQAMSQILNVIVKQAMSETGLLQFGNRPKFFDSTSPMNVEELQMQIWNGFKATAYKYQSGCALIIDSCSRFMSTKTVLDRIQELYDDIVDSNEGNASRAIDRFQDECRKEFVGSSIIANYGVKKTYIVDDIKFDLGPCNTFFDMRDGQKISVAKYFYKTYNLKISDKRQPMLMTKHQGRLISIPSEFCLMDGVPDSIRNNGKSMRTLLNKTKQTPDQKMAAIVKMVNSLFKMKKWAEWDIQVDQTPQALESRRLAAPELIHKEGDDKHLYASERLLKQMPVYQSDKLSKVQLIFVHDRYSANEADSARTNLMKCQGQMGMKSKEMQMLCLPDCRGNTQKIQMALDQFID